MAESFFIRSLSRQAVTNELFLGQTSRTITAALTMNNTGEPTLQVINAAAAQNIRLPLETINAGKVLAITAGGAGTLTLQSNAGAALAPPLTVATNACVTLFCDGIVWRAMSTS